MTRPKPFLTYFVLCAIPLLLLAGLNYWNGMRAVDYSLNTIVQDDLHSFTLSVDKLLDEEASVLLKLATVPEVQRAATDPLLHERLNGLFNPVFELRRFKSLAVYNRARQPLWHQASSPFEFEEHGVGGNIRAPIPIADERVWTTQGNVLLDRIVDDNSFSNGLNYSVPIHYANGLGNEGAITGALDLDKIFSSAARAVETRSAGSESIAPRIVVENRAGKVIYQSSGTARDSDATASSLMPRLAASLTIARSKAPFIASARRAGLAGFLMAFLLAALAAFLLERHVRRRSRGMARVTEDLSAIAKGELDRRIVLQSSDDARVIADNINVVTERLRAQIAREEESRQFESFVRISAMLTHDLKNAIEGLSLTVGNMERHFDNPQFRTDAMKGLTSATDKLKALVARLARPINSLSGEHKRPANVDLVPILKRVIAMTAEPTRGKHTIVTRLPQNLYALVDEARIEEVMENLVLNALEAMEHGGTLTIEAGQTQTGAPTFSVGDTGRGMSRVFIDNRLFRPFATTKKTGIGLGLYTCREVIKASAGTIEVDSVEGAGTTFRVVLPSPPHERRS
jgi:signal transduction histidine kinase